MPGIPNTTSTPSLTIDFTRASPPAHSGHGPSTPYRSVPAAGIRPLSSRPRQLSQEPPAPSCSMPRRGSAHRQAIGAPAPFRYARQPCWRGQVGELLGARQRQRYVYGGYPGQRSDRCGRLQRPLRTRLCLMAFVTAGEAETSAVSRKTANERGTDWHSRHTLRIGPAPTGLSPCHWDVSGSGSSPATARRTCTSIGNAAILSRANRAMQSAILAPMP